MPDHARPVSRLLIISSGAGSVAPSTAQRLRRAFADYTVMEFDPQADLLARLRPTARVIVAGGDGTVGFVARRLADSEHTLGIIPLGTYNNFARALNIPNGLQACIDLLKTGRGRPMTLGRAGDEVFLEACAIGVFGKAIVLGESAKEMRFGAFSRRLRGVSLARPFQFKVRGDFQAEGSALSLVCSNTPSTGARLRVGGSTPSDPYLELDVQVGQTRTDLIGRFVAAAVQSRREERAGGIRLRFRRLELETHPRLKVVADNMELGRTPMVIRADVGSLRVIAPPPGR